MNVIVNGSRREIAEGTTAAALLLSLGLADARVVVEVNGAIVATPGQEMTVLAGGDRVEIVRLVGGG